MLLKKYRITLVVCIVVIAIIVYAASTLVDVEVSRKKYLVKFTFTYPSVKIHC